MKNRLMTLGITLIIAGVLMGGYALYEAQSSGAFDERLQMALQSVQEPRFYEMTVDTATVVSQRPMRISGLYRLDFEAKRFGSYGTTTITIPDMPVKERTHTFTLQNVAIGDDVYVKIETTSPLLKKTIPYSDAWRHFTASTIPAQFTDIAVAGPVLDSLAILSSHGELISLMHKPVDMTLGTSTYHVYTFALSKKAQQVQGGTLKSLIGRIATGTVSILVDDTPTVRGLVVSGSNYVSTTTILSINTPLEVAAPVASQ